jgi:hypothetical protein
LSFQRVDLIGGKTAGDIGIALFDQQAARADIGHIAQDDVFELRLVGRIGLACSTSASCGV